MFLIPKEASFPMAKSMSISNCSSEISNSSCDSRNIPGKVAQSVCLPTSKKKKFFFTLENVGLTAKNKERETWLWVNDGRERKKEYFSIQNSLFISNLPRSPQKNILSKKGTLWKNVEEKEAINQNFLSSCLLSLGALPVLRRFLARGIKGYNLIDSPLMW